MRPTRPSSQFSSRPWSFKRSACGQSLRIPAAMGWTTHSISGKVLGRLFNDQVISPVRWLRVQRGSLSRVLVSGPSAFLSGERGVHGSERTTIDLVVTGCALSSTLFVLELFQSKTTLRTGFIPWAVATLAVSYGCAVVAALRSRAGVQSAVPRVAGWVAVIGLFGLAVFFLSVGLLGRAGTDLLSNADAPVAALGTLVASLTSIVIVPAALLIFGVGFIRQSRFPLWLRCLPLVTVVALLAAVGLAAVLETGEDRFLMGAMLAVLAAVAAFELGVTRTTSSTGS